MCRVEECQQSRNLDLGGNLIADQQGQCHRRDIIKLAFPMLCMVLYNIIEQLVLAQVSWATPLVPPLAQQAMVFLAHCARLRRPSLFRMPWCLDWRLKHFSILCTHALSRSER